MGETPFAAASLRSRSTERSNRMPPKSFGCSVFTRPPKTAGKPVTSATLVTGRPAAARCAAVPPVERRPKPSPVRARAKSTRPVRSETERSARRVLLTDGVRSFRGGVLRDGRDVASGSLPDPGEEAGREGDGRVVAFARGGRGKRRRGQYFGRREGLRRIAEKAGGLRDVRGRAALRRQGEGELVDDPARLIDDVVEGGVPMDGLGERARAAGRGCAMGGRVARAGFGGRGVAHALHEPPAVLCELTLEVRRCPGGRLGRHPSLSLIHISEPTRLGMISYAV